MTVTIGFFDNEESVLDAGRRLKEGCTRASGVRLLVQNAESAPILTAQSDIPVEEVYSIRDARGYGTVDGAPLGVAPFTAAGGYTGSSAVAGTGSPGIVVGGFGLEEGPDTEAVLEDIGIPDKHARSCSDAIDNGQYLLVAEGDLGLETADWMREAGAWKTLQ